jgi:hypothetical protein
LTLCSSTPEACASLNMATMAPGRANICPGREPAFWAVKRPVLRAHTKVPYKPDLHRKTLKVLKRPGRARTVCSCSMCRASSTRAMRRWTTCRRHALLLEDTEDAGDRGGEREDRVDAGWSEGALASQR